MSGLNETELRLEIEKELLRIDCEVAKVEDKIDIALELGKKVLEDSKKYE